MNITMVRYPLGSKSFVSSIKDDEIRSFLERRIKNLSTGEALYTAKLFGKTVSTWNDKPKFHIDRGVSGDEISVTVWTDHKVYYFIDQGTSIRYAHMTDDFVPKTTPGFIGSGPGKGGLAYVSWENPRPGITAREFSSTIYNMREKKFRLKISTEISKALLQYWNRIIGV